MSDENKIENEQEVQLDDGVISLDDLDSILAEEDPQFVEEMSVISNDETLKDANVEPIDFVDISDEKLQSRNSAQNELGEEVRKSSIFKKSYYNFKEVILNLKKKLINQVSLFQSLVLNFVKYEVPKLAVNFYKVSKKKGLLCLELGKSEWLRINSLPKKLKTGIAVLLVFTIGILIGVFLSLKNNWIPQIYKPLHKSISELANSESLIESNETWVELYRAFPQPEYFVLLDKVIVNLKRRHSFENPMTVIEFYLELDSQDTAVEISDRKIQVLDATQRAVEEFTYPEIQSKAGILKLKATVRSEVNSLLNQGRVSKVYINTIVTKK